MRPPLLLLPSYRALPDTPKHTRPGHTSMPLPMLYPLWSHASLLPSPCPQIAKSCSLFRTQLKCHLLWEGFSCPSSKNNNNNNNHPSCWLVQPRTASQESRGAESVQPLQSLHALIYKMEANHLYPRGWCWKNSVQEGT